MDVPCSKILHIDHKQNDLCGFSCLTEAITVTLTLSNKLVVFYIYKTIMSVLISLFTVRMCQMSDINVKFLLNYSNLFWSPLFIGTQRIQIVDTQDY